MICKLASAANSRQVADGGQHQIEGQYNGSRRHQFRLVQSCQEKSVCPVVEKNYQLSHNGWDALG